jgi:hypothetical protein
MAELITWCRLMRIGPACATPCEGCRIASRDAARAGITIDPEKFYDADCAPADDEQPPDPDALRIVQRYLNPPGMPYGLTTQDIRSIAKDTP